MFFKSSFVGILDLDVTGNSEEEEEKQRLIERVLELQSTLEGLVLSSFFSLNLINQVFEFRFDQKNEYGQRREFEIKIREWNFRNLY